MWYFLILGIVVLFPLRFKDRARWRARWRAHSETSPGERRCVAVPARTGRLHVPPGHPQPLAVEARPAGHVRLPPRLRPVARLSGCTSSRGPGGGGGGRDLSLDLPAAQCSLPRKHRSAPPAVCGVYGSSLAAGGPCPAFGHRRAFPLCVLGIRQRKRWLQSCLTWMALPALVNLAPPHDVKSCALVLGIRGGEDA